MDNGEKIDKILETVTQLRIEMARHDERAIRMSQVMDGQAQSLEDHTRQDAVNFSAIKKDLGELKLAKAVEEKSSMRVSAKVAGAISLLITAIAMAVFQYFHIPTTNTFEAPITVEEQIIDQE